MKLTTEQIDQLYAFTIKHYVEYYDLQTELVDHLANAIEQQWQENPKLSFDEALNLEFKKFGIFGFTDLVAQRKGVLEKKYFKLLWGHLVSFFRLPKIIATVLLLFGAYSVFKRIPFTEEVESIIWFSMIFVSIVFAIVESLKKAKKKSKGEKIWLFDRVINNLGRTTFIIAYFVHYVNRLVNFIDGFLGTYEDSFMSIYCSILVVCYLLLIYIIKFDIPSKAEQYLKETYPEYELCK